MDISIKLIIFEKRVDNLKKKDFYSKLNKNNFSDDNEIEVTRENIKKV